MATRSKIIRVVFGVTIVIALLIYKCLASIADFPVWLEVTATAIGILSLIILGCAEIRKISWLGLAEQTDNAPTELPPADNAPPAAASHAIKVRVNSQITIDKCVKKSAAEH